MLPAMLFQMAVAFAAVTLAQTTTSTSTSTSASASATTTHVVAVGADGFVFTPNQVTNASVGDIIRFKFYPGGHTVVRAEYGYPCIPYDYTGSNKVGFYSGNISPQILSDNLPIFDVRVNDTEPIFFYCSAPGSCFQHQMIGVINPSANETFDGQMAYALNATYQLAPGDQFPSETVSSTSSPTQTATNTPSSSTTAASSHSGSSGLGAGPIAGIAIGAAAVLILAGALVYLCGRRGGIDKAYRRSTMTFPPPMVEAKFGPKSPAQATFTSTSHYSMPPEQDPYRSQTQSPPMQQYVQSPPPLSPGLSPNSNQTYTTYQTSLQQGLHSPLMGDMQSQQGTYYPNQVTPPPDQIYQYQQPQQAVAPVPAPAPVELPTSENPGHSPLPDYQPSRQYSWAQGAEGMYRPSNKT